MSGSLEISVQGTPNPNALKFTLNRTVAAQGATYREAGSAQTEWAKQILQRPGVTQVFALNNFISINQQPEADWAVLTPQVEQILQRTLASTAT